ncbi:MAG: LacI family transcriptional regulator [Saprospiraceae bacterium]|jgi:LacI family transcriptional regulator
MDKIVTIKDIARKFNCSPSTVSRALNDHPSINQFTRKHIQKYALEVGYRKNKTAINFQKSKTKMVGVIMPYLDGYFNSSVLDGMQRQLEPQGYSINIFLSYDRFDAEVTYIDKLIENNTDGIFIALSKETQSYQKIELIKQRNIPLVLFDRVCDFSAHKVHVDQYAGAKLATKHLIDMGCQKIAHIAGPSGLLSSKSRLRGYLDTLKEGNLLVKDELIKTAGFNAWSGVYPTEQLFRLPEPPDGIFAANDYVAIAIVHTLRKLGLRVPQDVAVIGFDNDPRTAFLNPTLSTIEQPANVLGEEVARIFRQEINHVGENHFETQEIVLPPQLIIRESTIRI